MQSRLPGAAVDGCLYSENGHTDMKSNAKLYALIAICSLSGCATGARYPGAIVAPSDKAVVYVYRERRVLGSGGSPDVFINGEKIVEFGSR